MTRDQSKRLKVGDRVAWHDNATDQGTVIATDGSGVQIDWDNGKTQFFHHNNMTEVSTAPLRQRICESAALRVTRGDASDAGGLLPCSRSARKH